MTFQEFIDKYYIRTNFLRYMGVISAIKKYLNVIDIELSVQPAITFQNYDIKVLSGKTINLSKCKSKTFYLEFVNFKLEPPSSLFKWSEKHSLDESLFYNSLPLAKKCTQEPKLLAIQFKIIHDITNCVVNLCKWKISDSDRCEYCSIQDTMIHAFTECPSTLQGIREVLDIIDPYKKCQKKLQNLTSFLVFRIQPLI